jgi:hypothetical protein
MKLFLIVDGVERVATIRTGHRRTNPVLREVAREASQLIAKGHDVQIRWGT